MLQRRRRVSILLLLLLVFTVINSSGCGQQNSKIQGPTDSATQTDISGGGQPDISAKPVPSTTTATLYFSDKEAMYLVPVERQITKGTETLEAAIINELIRGPLDSGLSRTIPAETKLLSVSVLDGTAYVNFSKEFKTKHWGGSSGETMTIYSVVNSLGKLPGIQKVQFLLEGQKVESIFGHNDTSLPFTPDWALIYKTDSGRYVGQIDNNSIEVKISGVPDTQSPRVFRLDEAAKSQLASLNLKTNDNVKFNYYLNAYGQSIITQITKM